MIDSDSVDSREAPLIDTGTVYGPAPTVIVGGAEIEISPPAGAGCVAGAAGVGSGGAAGVGTGGVAGGGVGAGSTGTGCGGAGDAGWIVVPGMGELPGGICGVAGVVGAGGAPITSGGSAAGSTGGTEMSGGGPAPSARLLCGPM